MATASPRIEVRLKAPRVCYLSGELAFYLMLDGTLYDKDREGLVFLQDGCAGSSGYQPINSTQVIQCFDCQSGEEVEIVHQGTKPVFHPCSGATFTTSEIRKPHQFPILVSSLQPDRKYRLCFKPTDNISYWPASAFNPLDSDTSNPSISSSTDLPAPFSELIPWKAADGHGTLYFKTRASLPIPPSITLSLSAPSTLSLSQPFKFTLTFSTDAARPINVLADRENAIDCYRDIEILDAASRKQLAPDLELNFDGDDVPTRDQFMTLDGTYVEHREMELDDYFWNDVTWEIGKEYILRHQGDAWLWTEDSIDEVMAYLESSDIFGLEYSEGTVDLCINGEVRLKVVE